MSTYLWCRLGLEGSTWQEAHHRLRDADLHGADVWGAFRGLFGIRSDELVVVLHGQLDAAAASLEAAGFDVAETHAFEPTVRPVGFEPLGRPGLYVFRFFDVSLDDIDEIARLSNEAWTTFETDTSFTAEPQALFAPADRSSATGLMLLVTGYDGLASWETSRSPAPEAVENFRRRRALTRGAIAYATALIEP